MKNENVAFEHEEAIQETSSTLHTVTPLSKYLAMTLFVILPFLGGWIGYTYAPEKVVEINGNATESGVTVENTSSEISAEDFENYLRSKLENPDPTITIGEPYIDFWNEVWQITNFNFNEVSELTAKFDWLNKNYRQIRLSTDYASYYLFDVSTLKVVRSLDDEKPNRYNTVTDWYWTLNNRRGIEVAVSDKEVTLHDYVNQEKYVLYEEEDAGVSLLEACELGCEGLLDIRSNNDIVIGRYQLESGDPTIAAPRKLIEAIVLEIPEDWN